MKDDAALDKILGFLLGELARKEGRLCVAVELLFVPGPGFRDEKIRTWEREDETDLFDDAGKLTSQIVEIANVEPRDRLTDKARFRMCTRQCMGGRATLLFTRGAPSSPKDLVAALSDEEQVAIDLLLPLSVPDPRLVKLVPSEKRRDYLSVLARQLASMEAAS